MDFNQSQKTKSYYKRYQVKFRRRREGKTDYFARKRLVTQPKTKFNAPKYRFVVRITNKDIVCQIVSSKLVGDQVLCHAYAHELPRYGVTFGLTNYAAAYCTGLLLARRLLKKVGLDQLYEGLKEASGEYFVVDDVEGERHAFMANLDCGLARTTTGARVFGAVKGACDGGLYIPHKAKRFYGYKGDVYDPAKHTDRILGQHVAKYMNDLEKSDKKKFESQFSQYIKNKISADNIKDIYQKAHAAIRKDPSFTKKVRKAGDVPSFRKKKQGIKQRKARVAVKKAKILKKLAEQ